MVVEYTVLLFGLPAWCGANVLAGETLLNQD